MVRRRHRPEVRQVRPRVPEPARGGRGDAAVGCRARRRCIGSESALEFALSGHREMDDMIAHHAAMTRGARRAARTAATRCSRRSVLRTSSGTARGWPGKLKGEDGPTRVAARAARPSSSRSRIASAASKRPRALARERADKQFDPQLAQLRRATRAEMILAGLEDGRDLGRGDRRRAGARGRALGDRFDAALLAIANFVDLKSPYTSAMRARSPSWPPRPATQLGLSDEDELRTLRRAGLVHDLGRLGVSNAIWDKPGPLGAGEWERVRLHPYLTERMLQQSAALAPLGAIAVQHRERLDGSGYPRGLSGRCDRRAGSDPRRGRRLPGDARAASLPPERSARRGGRASSAPTSRPGASTPTRSRPFSAPPATASRAAAKGRPA